MAEKNALLHYTCTGSDLSTLPGADKEHIPEEYLNKLYQIQTNTPVSEDPGTARLQREQAIRRFKRNPVALTDLIT